MRFKAGRGDEQGSWAVMMKHLKDFHPILRFLRHLRRDSLRILLGALIAAVVLS